MSGTNVNLIPVWTGNSFKKWNMSMNGGSTKGPGDYPHIQVNDTSGPTITFTIINPNGVEFNSSNPIYVRAGTAKPGHEVDPQFTYSLGPDTHNNLNAVLTVNDSNQNPGPYNYVLYFNRSDISPLDPIIDNSGPHVSNYLVWYAVGGVALLALAVLVLRPMMRNRQTRQ